RVRRTRAIPPTAFDATERARGNAGGIDGLAALVDEGHAIADTGVLRRSGVALSTDGVAAHVLVRAEADAEVTAQPRVAIEIPSALEPARLDRFPAHAVHTAGRARALRIIGARRLSLAARDDRAGHVRSLLTLRVHPVPDTARFDADAGVGVT